MGSNPVTGTPHRIIAALAGIIDGIIEGAKKNIAVINMVLTILRSFIVASSDIPGAKPGIPQPTRLPGVRLPPASTIDNAGRGKSRGIARLFLRMLRIYHVQTRSERLSLSFGAL